MNLFFIRKPFKYTFFSAALILIVINCFFFFILQRHDNLTYYLGISPVLFFRERMFWQPLTYMFVHSNFTHIFSNMLGLLFFGVTLERAIGSKEFLLFYFMCGIVSGLLSITYYILIKNYGVILIGASGVLYAVMLGYAAVYPRSNIYIWGILPIPSPILILIYTGIELFGQFYKIKSNIAHFTHLLGFAAAFLYFIIRIGKNPVTIWKNAYKNQY